VAITNKAIATRPEMALRDQPNLACHAGKTSDSDPCTENANASVRKPRKTTIQRPASVGALACGRSTDMRLFGWYQIFLIRPANSAIAFSTRLK
jgi:hypothetical protein